MQQMTVKPNLQTRESVMLAAGRAQFAVTDRDDGLTCYVKFECKRKAEHGQGYEKGTVPLDEATHVFVSEKGYGTTRLGTYYPPRDGYETGRFYEADDFNPASPHMDAVWAVVELVTTGSVGPEGPNIEVESRCGLCGRELTDPVSIQRGIGPECASKPTGTKILHASKFSQQGIPDEYTADAFAMAQGTKDSADATALPTNAPCLDLDDYRTLRAALSCYGTETDGTERSNRLYAQIDSYIENQTRSQEKMAFARREAAQERTAHSRKLVERGELEQQLSRTKQRRRLGMA